MKKNSADWQPVIIVGAPRSGTNMLRDVMAKLPGMGTWPCDEINYIWRYGNARYPSDKFPKKLATPKVVRYIRNEFQKLANEMKLKYVLEKTCANSLRVGFIDEIFPDAKYIFIVRDGIDASLSATKRWKAKLDVGYIVKKAKYVPISDMPYYASKYIMSRIFLLLSRQKRLSSWGPRIENLQIELKNRPLDEVCALQWKDCVDLAVEDFRNIDSSRIFSVKYETFVHNPDLQILKIAEFLGYDSAQLDIPHLVSSVKKENVNKGKNEISKEDIQRLTVLLEPTLKEHGYL